MKEFPLSPRSPESGSVPGSNDQLNRKGEQSSLLNRRQFLEMAAGASALALAGTVANRLVEKYGDTEEEPLNRKERVTQEPRRIKTGELEGKNFTDLYAAYTGISGKASPEVEVNFQKHLQDLWDRKNKRASDKKTVKNTGLKLVDEYRRYEPTFSSLEEYSGKVEATVAQVKKTMDWDKLTKIRGLNEEQLAMVKEIAEQIEGKDLLAYSLTELMPSPTGKFNLQVLEFLLKNAGEEYVESLPAVYDDKTSFGPYQFTEYALFDANGRQEGASKINRALRKDQIPGSVAKLRGQQHHKAAFLFMIENYCKLVKRVNNKQRQVLERVYRAKRDDLVVYAATAHHGPEVALKIAGRWLDNDAEEDYKISAGSIYLQYANKTEANLEALR